VSRAVTDSLGSGITAAHALPADLRTQITAQARQAFTDGFTRSALAAAVLAAVVAIVLLIPTRAVDGSEAAEPDRADSDLALVSADPSDTRLSGLAR
jgi:hypothetical protein